MKKVAIIILDFNTHDETIECLESLQKIDAEGLTIKVFVVDNGSTQESESFLRYQKSKIKNQKSEVEFIRNNINLGFAGGNNLGIKHAQKWGAEYIMFLNNDTLVHKDFVKELIRPFDNEKKVAITVPKIYFAPGFEFHKDRYKKEEVGKVIWYAGGIIDWKNVIGHHKGVDEVDHGQFDEESETDYATGCCFVIRADVLEKVGVYDEKYYLYYEEIDLCMRLKRLGYKILYVPKSELWHKNAASSGGSGSVLQDYYISRNRILFAMRYAPVKSKLHVIRESLKLLVTGRKWQKAGIRDFYIQNFGRGSYKVY